MVPFDLFLITHMGIYCPLRYFSTISTKVQPQNRTYSLYLQSYEGVSIRPSSVHTTENMS